MIFQTHKCAETQQLGYNFAKTLQGGEVLALKGDLGCGKTTFVQGLAKGLGIKEKITSPTFVLLKEYRFIPKKLQATSASLREAGRSSYRLAHLDCYRLGSSQDAQALGLAEYLSKPDIVTVIEWPERIKDLLPKETIWIKFHHKLPEVREIRINSAGKFL